MTNLINGVSVTSSASSNEYIFQCALSALNIERLKYDSLLFGFISIPKNKYQFLNDLSELIAVELVKHFELMEENNIIA